MIRLAAARTPPLGAIFGAIGVSAAATVALLGLDHLPVSLCGWKLMTGFPCPTCGTVRAAVALAGLDVLGALRSYPLPALGWIVFIGAGLSASALELCGRTPPAIPNHLPNWAKLAVVGAVLANWMYSIATGV